MIDLTQTESRLCAYLTTSDWVNRQGWQWQSNGRRRGRSFGAGAHLGRRVAAIVSGSPALWRMADTLRKRPVG
jgi:hypothetical protein